MIYPATSSTGLPFHQLDETLDPEWKTSWELLLERRRNGDPLVKGGNYREFGSAWRLNKEVSNGNSNLLHSANSSTIIGYGPTSTISNMHI